MDHLKALPKTLILSPLTCFSKKRLFEELCEVAAAVSDNSPNELIKGLNKREKCGATICPNGVGMPNTAVADLESSFAVLAVLPEKIQYNTIDSDTEEADVAFAIFFAEDTKQEEASELMRCLFNCFKNQDLVNSLRRVRYDENKLKLILQRLDSLLYKTMHPEPVNVLQEIRKEALENQKGEETDNTPVPKISTDSIELMIIAEKEKEAEEKEKTDNTKENDAVLQDTQAVKEIKELSSSNDNEHETEKTENNSAASDKYDNNEDKSTENNSEVKEEEKISADTPAENKDNEKEQSSDNVKKEPPAKTMSLSESLSGNKIQNNDSSEEDIFSDLL